jgi:hypothetical protein
MRAAARSRRGSAHRALVEEAGRQEALELRQRDVGLDVQAVARPNMLAVFRQVADAVATASCGERIVTARRARGSRRHRSGRRRRPRGHLGAAGAHQPAKPRISPLRTSKLTS